MKANRVRRFGIGLLAAGIAMLLAGIALLMATGNVLASVLLTGSIPVNTAAVVCLRHRGR